MLRPFDPLDNSRTKETDFPSGFVFCPSFIEGPKGKAPINKGGENGGQNGGDMPHLFFVIDGEGVRVVVVARLAADRQHGGPWRPLVV